MLCDFFLEANCCFEDAANWILSDCYWTTVVDTDTELHRPWQGRRPSIGQRFIFWLLFALFEKAQTIICCHKFLFELFETRNSKYYLMFDEKSLVGIIWLLFNDYFHYLKVNYLIFYYLLLFQLFWTNCLMIYYFNTLMINHYLMIIL